MAIKYIKDNDLGNKCLICKKPTLNKKWLCPLHNEMKYENLIEYDNSICNYKLNLDNFKNYVKLYYKIQKELNFQNKNDIEIIDKMFLEVNSYCLICHKKVKDTYGIGICIDCVKAIDEINKNLNFNINDNYIIHENYFNCKQQIIEEIKSKKFDLTNLQKLVHYTSLAQENNNYILSENLRNEINNLYNLKNQKIEIKDIDIRNKWPKPYQCEDGHYVRSLSEKIIDDWLYNHHYIHSYEKQVFPENPKLSDFYLPIQNIYIEFWGVENNDEYNKSKDEKLSLYKKHKYNLINLYPKDLQLLNDTLPKLLNKYNKN